MTRVGIVAGFSLIPGMMNAIIFGYVWASSRSLAVVKVYHSAFDEMRESIERSVGFGLFVDLYWQNGPLTLLGLFLLWKGNWSNLKRRDGTPARLPDGTGAMAQKAG